MSAGFYPQPEKNSKRNKSTCHICICRKKNLKKKQNDILLYCIYVHKLKNNIKITKHTSCCIYICFICWIKNIKMKQKYLFLHLYMLKKMKTLSKVYCMWGKSSIYTQENKFSNTTYVLSISFMHMDKWVFLPCKEEYFDIWDTFEAQEKAN